MRNVENASIVDKMIKSAVGEKSYLEPGKRIFGFFF